MIFPFHRTAKTVINVFEGTICLDYHGEKLTFNIDEAMKGPLDTENVYSIDVFGPFVQEHLETKFLQDRVFDLDFVGMAEREAVSMCDMFSNQGLSDEEISQGIMAWCETPEFTGSA